MNPPPEAADPFLPMLIMMGIAFIYGAVIWTALERLNKRRRNGS
jgi:hypothetical protein